MSRSLIALFVAYVGWSLLALVEIALRKGSGASSLPGILADHNGNIAVSGFILFAAYPGAALEVAGTTRRSRWLGHLAALTVPAAALAWGVFFVAMELVPLYGPNTQDVGDVPASVFGMLCGLIFGRRFQQRLVDQGFFGGRSAR